MNVKVLFSFAAVGAFLSLPALDMGGAWKVSGNGIDAVATLPGTLADSGIGKVQSYETWNAISNKQERYALRLQHQFIGPATYSRKVNVSADMVGKPLELFLERVLWPTVRWRKAGIGWNWPDRPPSCAAPRRRSSWICRDPSCGSAVTVCPWN